MDPLKALDMKQRSGISQHEVDAFVERMDLVAQALDDIKNDTFDPLKCNIPGYKTIEQEEAERQEQVKREEERRKKAEERKQKEKQKEHDKWWYKAKLRYSLSDKEDEKMMDDEKKKKKRTDDMRPNLAAYQAHDANDYSIWRHWVPEDPVSIEEHAEREAELENQRNRAFEQQNPDFCTQFKTDMDARQRAHDKLVRTTECLKQKGNRLYKKKEYLVAIKWYMEALSVSPFTVAVLANIAQCYLRLDKLDDCIEFCTRTLYVDATYVKALSRRATALYRQKKLKEAAEDMRQALALDRDNADLVEQYSVIVGDYEDLLSDSNLETALNEQQNNEATEFNASSMHELRVALELCKKLSEKNENPTSWRAYNLLLPLMATNEYVRAKFRTSGEMTKLCDRIVSLLTAELSDTTQQSPKDERLSIMIECVTAAVTNTPRNQVVLFRYVTFQHMMLYSLSKLATLSSSPPVQASLVAFFDHVVASKCWRQAILASTEAISSLLRALCLDFKNKKKLSNDRMLWTSTVEAATSLCFTLSKESAGLELFSTLGLDCLASVTQALEQNDKASPSLENLLGFVSNLSTHPKIRKTLESPNCQSICRQLVQLLLHNGETASVCSERALGALLNFSFEETSVVRTVHLVALQTVETVDAIFTHSNVSPRSVSLLTLSYSVSLLNRLHYKTDHQNERLASLPLLSNLYHVFNATSSSVCDEKAPLSDEIAHLWAQIWCHFGWCAHLSTTRDFLREKRVLPVLLHVITLTNARHAYRRRQNEAATACERLVGNLAKVLSAIETDKEATDLVTLKKKENLVKLVKSLETLTDGTARKNVAILLAKLCQADEQVKDTVRELRGMEMMLTVSQAIRS